MVIELKDIDIPAVPPTYSDVVKNGQNILPQRIIQLYDDKEWEQYTEECTHSLKKEYHSVSRASGAGDQGIDIAAFKTDKGFAGGWDNYQCKHYKNALYPTDVWLELGKLCYYTFIKEYSVPENYYFVAPLGIGTALSKLLRGGKPDELRKQLIKAWKKQCENAITSTKKVPLTGGLKAYVEAFDFSIVKDKTVLQMLEIHRKTPYYHHRFGGGLPLRPANEVPPDDHAEIEAVYIQKLLDAYAEFLQKDTCDISDVESNVALKKHLRDARIHFYCAESLHKFSRDYLEHGEFERLQDEIFTGIENIILSEHNNGLERVKNAVQEAYKIQIDSHPLKERLETRDRAGICHQLANNNKVSWANGSQES